MVSYSLSSSLPTPEGEVRSWLGMLECSFASFRHLCLLLRHWNDPGQPFLASHPIPSHPIPSHPIPSHPLPAGVWLHRAPGAPPGWELTARAATPLSFHNQIIPMFMPR